ncbi:MAG: hypothetical protein HY360_27255 [Verrucomicrobia bacterium]|nr:hypothetical protein [Verrucomicrobiota bacterium]
MISLHHRNRKTAKTSRSSRRCADEDALVALDPVAAVETAILESARKRGVVPHQKILSRSKLARLLRTTPYRVQLAVQRLEQHGLVYTRKGSGVYLAEKLFQRGADQAPQPQAGTAAASEAKNPAMFLSLPFTPIFKTIRVLVDGIEADEIQVGLWRRVFDVFQQEYPFVNLEPDFGRAQPGSSHDVVISSLGAVRDNLSTQKPLDVRLLAQGGLERDAFLDGLLDQGRAAPSRELFALPLLRTTTILVANHRLLEQFGLADRPINRPVDWFRVSLALVERSGGQTLGFNYCGFQFHSTFYGVEFQEQDGCWVFDRARMARFLEDIKPCLRRDQLAIKWNMKPFFNGTVGFCCNYLHSYPWIVKRLGPAAKLLRLPVEPGGFVTESSCVGTVSDSTDSVKEATLLLGFIASEKGQTALLANHPEWLSVNQAVLAGQAAASPFPEGAVIYAYDPRGVHGEVHLRRSSMTHLPRMETEAAKFYLGLQSLEETLAEMAGDGRKG